MYTPRTNMTDEKKPLTDKPKNYLCSTCGYRTSQWLNLMTHAGAVHDRNLLPEEHNER